LPAIVDPHDAGAGDLVAAQRGDRHGDGLRGFLRRCAVTMMSPALACVASGAAGAAVWPARRR
jgi:hypothetical protein